MAESPCRAATFVLPLFVHQARYGHRLILSRLPPLSSSLQRENETAAPDGLIVSTLNRRRQARFPAPWQYLALFPALRNKRSGGAASLFF